jgi:FdrA protein
VSDASVAVVLVDVVIGYGACDDPAGAIVRLVKSAARPGPAIVASVTGTDADPQNRSMQVRTLETAGILVAPSNAEAALLAVQICARSN